MPEGSKRNFHSGKLPTFQGNYLKKSFLENSPRSPEDSTVKCCVSFRIASLRLISLCFVSSTFKYPALQPPSKKESFGKSVENNLSVIIVKKQLAVHLGFRNFVSKQSKVNLKLCLMLLLSL